MSALFFLDSLKITFVEAVQNLKQNSLTHIHLKPIQRQYFVLSDLIYSSHFCVCFIVILVAARHFRQVGIGGKRRLGKMCNELKKKPSHHVMFKDSLDHRGEHFNHDH